MNEKLINGRKNECERERMNEKKKEKGRDIERMKKSWKEKRIDIGKNRREKMMEKIIVTIIIMRKIINEKKTMNERKNERKKWLKHDKSQYQNMNEL